MRTGLVLLLLLVALGVGEAEILSKCDAEYSRCAFHCTQKFPLDKKKWNGCMSRCDLDKKLCKAGKKLEEFKGEAEDFFKGFFSR